MGAEQSEPFLGRYDSDEEDPKTDDSYEADLKPRVWNWKRNACIHATLILLYTFSSFIIIKRQTSVSCTPEANCMSFSYHLYGLRVNPPKYERTSYL
jgi:hypothetical protein